MTDENGNTKELEVRPRRRLGLFNIDDMDRYFADVMRGFGMRPFRRMAPFGKDDWIPTVDMVERDGNIVVKADIPGIDREDIEITVEDNLLTIRGEREEETETKEEGYYYTERATGTFARTITLPEGTDPDAMTATYNDGVLEVTMPAPAKVETKAKRIELN